MRNISSPEGGSSWLGRNLGRLAICTVLGISACTPNQKVEPQKTSELSEAFKISNQKAIELAIKAVQYNELMGYKQVGGKAQRDIVKGDVSRIGDDNWDNAFARATLNSTREYPAARFAQPKNTIVVYLTLKSGSGIVVALDSDTGTFISMDGDN